MYYEGKRKFESRLRQDILRVFENYLTIRIVEACNK